MYQVMVEWEGLFGRAGLPPVVADYARIWHEADKIVYSTTLPEVASERTRLERRFDVSAVAELKGSASRDSSIGGPGVGSLGPGSGAGR